MRLVRALICVGDLHIANFCDLLPSKSRQRSAVIVTIGCSDISLLPKKDLSVIKIFGFCIVTLLSIPEGVTCRVEDGLAFLGVSGFGFLR